MNASETVTINGVKLIAERDMVVRAFRHRGEFEPKSMARWREIAGSADGYMIDVGAYTGIYAIAARQEGARVWAIEPMADTAARLRRNAALNGATVTVMNMAASDIDGDVRMSVPFSLSSASSISETGRTIVAARRLDTIFHGTIAKISAIKIDAERAETAVIRGAAEIIARDRPIIIAEVLDANSRDEIAALLPGYRCIELDTAMTEWRPE